MESDDLVLARELQAQFDLENLQAAHAEVADFLPVEFRTPGKSSAKSSSSSSSSSLVAPEWEDIDPTPDLHALFLQYNGRFFNGRLSGCEVKWSPRMTLCAGVCSYQRRAGYCSIRLSVPLLKLRPRSDLVETLLHEMIHAFLFVTDGNDDHSGHGPAFHEHMHRINKEAGTKISVYHNFHDEVAHHLTHWWKCNGPCQSRKPFFGLVKRSMNRAPGSYDSWFDEHQRSCGGTFVKIKEPEGYAQKKSSKKKLKLDTDGKKQMDIRSFAGDEVKSPGAKKPAGGCKDGSVGSATGIAAPTEDVRQTMRDFWSNRYPEKSAAASGKENLSESNSCCVCPVCSQNIPSDRINLHLDECLNMKTVEGRRDDDDSQTCVKCRREVLREEFDFHKKMCL